MTSLPFNYYNYFTEIEDFFIQKRGKHILLSPLDWILIETWKNMGIPLHVALRGIERSVSLFNEKESRHRYVNTLYYCNQSVLEEHEQYLLGMEGAHPAEETKEVTDSRPQADNDDAGQLIDRQLRQLASDLDTVLQRYPLPRVQDTIPRIQERLSTLRSSLSINADLEILERDLNSIDDILVPCLKSCLDQEKQQVLLKECRTRLKHHKKSLPKKMYETILANFMSRTIKDHFGIITISLLELHQ